MCHWVDELVSKICSNLRRGDCILGVGVVWVLEDDSWFMRGGVVGRGVQLDEFFQFV